ncbi:hypothetical protein MMON_49800 [Mycolicibacterium monacense]|uniref:Uncharacterized protein n=1 Tax=Mycolicibacterium monacense TaxID=85693 RepID=A0AAD1IZA2_MYCMB|nr:hypothetical protein MMON_49800 [Mycolicibacterium monacense]
MAGRTIVITGASDGVGAAAAKRLSRSGENVVVVGRSPQKTAAVADALEADSFVADFPISRRCATSRNGCSTRTRGLTCWPTMPAG